MAEPGTHQPMQGFTPMKPDDYAVQFNLGPLEAMLRVGMRRLDRRQKCAHCGNRRVCFVVGVGDLVTSPPSCAKCAGLRR